MWMTARPLLLLLLVVVVVAGRGRRVAGELGDRAAPPSLVVDRDPASPTSPRRRAAVPRTSPRRRRRRAMSPTSPGRRAAAGRGARPARRPPSHAPDTGPTRRRATEPVVNAIARQMLIWTPEYLRNGICQV